MLYRRGRVFWFEFTVGGRRYRETTRTTGRALAASVERKRRREIEENINGIRPRVLPPLFSDAADEYLTRKKPSWAPKTYVIENTNIEHLKSHFGRLLVTDITDRDISEYSRRGKMRKLPPRRSTTNSAQCERFSVVTDYGRSSLPMSECCRSAPTLA